ncbi:ATP-binding cassette transporter, subfamily C, member 15, SmABCC15 [Corchorus olitorius]|uniref:ATP-binding cassette transporter, subfamily C, member 15, SmABCC15 n=1 Tax=Corchorus olitorius TaxID=93759 RepID=A0A1R3J0M3_9ROSI|nr:ATP-binding cassette transporter, subfamily C, member 15, SmABCC15 [Corchorus olitorius]
MTRLVSYPNDESSSFWEVSGFFEPMVSFEYRSSGYDELVAEYW